MGEAGRWALGVCTCGVVATIVEMLASNTRLEKNIRFVLGALLLCVVILPLGNVLSEAARSLSIPSEVSEISLTDSLSESRQKYVEDAVCRLIREKLAGEGIEPAEIRVKTDIDGEQRITMITAELSIRRIQANRAAEAAALVKNDLGIPCRTIITT